MESYNSISGASAAELSNNQSFWRVWKGSHIVRLSGAVHCWHCINWDIRLSIMTCVLNNMLRTIGWFFSALELITYLVLFPNPYLSSSTWDSSTPTPNCPGDVCSTLPELFEIRTYLFLLFLHVFTYPVSPTFCVLRGIPNLSRFISKIIFSMILSLIIHFPLPYPGKCYTCLSLHYLVYS